MKDISERLAAAGLGAAETEKKTGLFRRTEQQLGLLAAKAHVASRRFVPGRLEVLGKHTDYAGGRSLLATVERGFCVVAAPRRDSMVRVVDAVLGRVMEFEIAADLDVSAAGWTIYPMTVARRIARNFAGNLAGADIVFGSDLPRSAGLSSSSALVVAVFLALSDVNRLEQRPEYQKNIHGTAELAGYLTTHGGEPVLRRFFAERAEHRLGRARARLVGLRGCKRLEEVAGILSEEGYMAEVVNGALRLAHCPLRDVVAVTHLPCRAELALVESLLGRPLERTDYLPDGGAACAYRPRHRSRGEATK